MSAVAGRPQLPGRLSVVRAGPGNKGRRTHLAFIRLNADNEVGARLRLPGSRGPGSTSCDGPKTGIGRGRFGYAPGLDPAAVLPSLAAGGPISNEPSGPFGVEIRQRSSSSTAACRVGTASLRRIDETCVRTVPAEMNSRPAMSSVERP